MLAQQVWFFFEMGQINDLDTESLQGDLLAVLTPAVAPASECVVKVTSPVPAIYLVLFTNKCKVKKRCT